MGCQSSNCIKEISTNDFNKELCKQIFNSLPSRNNTDLLNLKNMIKSLTIKCSQKEKYFIIYLWICENIEYDYNSFITAKFINCSPDYVLSKGKTVCSGFARLFKDIASFLELNVQCIKCYTKGYGYEPGRILTKLNHEYNLIDIDNIWHPIDLTLGGGHIEGDEFIKKFNDYFFCLDPEFMILTHYPENRVWQLTKKIYTLTEFLKWPQVFTNFYVYKFNKFFPEEGYIILENSNKQKFVIWSENMEKRNASCKIYFFFKNRYKQLLNCDKINFYNNRFEVDCIFNKKGKYKIDLFGNDDGSPKTYKIITYILIVEKSVKKELKYPLFYNESKSIQIYEPLYNDIKSGDKVKFKIKSDLDKIIIIDEKWYYLTKNKNGFFEKEIIVKNHPGEKIVIAKENEHEKNTGIFMASYNIS